LVTITLMIVTSFFHLGTHYDISPVVEFSIFDDAKVMESNSAEHLWTLVFFPQLVLWPAVTIIAGMAVGCVAYGVVRRRDPGPELTA
jgi:hypothetical protein